MRNPHRLPEYIRVADIKGLAVACVRLIRVLGPGGTGNSLAACHGECNPIR